MSRNFFTGFDQPIFPLTNLHILRLDSDELQGSIPIPTHSIFIYCVSNNFLTEEFSPLLCNLSSLAFVDLSNYYFNGSLPYQHFQNWISVKGVDAANLSYLQADKTFRVENYSIESEFL
ncbi:hypothetical protein CRYUN_Cryun01aG0129800 [Craigia yunnanensis]